MGGAVACGRRLLTRYFITGSNKRILLEHDEEYCAAGMATSGDTACVQMDADAADIDMNTAYYLEQVNYATNANGMDDYGRGPGVVAAGEDQDVRDWA